MISDFLRFATLSKTTSAFVLCGLLVGCSPNNKGDLAAADWCYIVNDSTGQITFYPIVKNVGSTNWTSQQEGKYAIGVGVNSKFSENNYTLPASPNWSLEKGQTSRLSGRTEPFSSENDYSLKNIWVLVHAEDTNPNNNRHPGEEGVFKGKQFMTGGALYGKQCKTPWE
jgi:hypothetical protein